jgi:predicted dehydrogenase
MAALRVGIVGYGFAGRTFHAPVLAGVPGLPVEADPAALFARPDIDLVVIATPNDSHHGLARAALLAGKHVVVDKPFTQTLAEAQDLAALAHTTGRVLSVFQNRRFDGDYLTLRGLLARGELGRVVYCESHFDRYRPQVLPRWRDRPGAGGIWPDLGSHLADQALQLFGLPDAISADMAPIRDGAVTEDYFHVQLRYAQGPQAGLRVVLHSTTMAAEPAPRFLVHGTHGSYSKHGVDVQEDVLKTGARPSLDALGDWGRDARDGRLTLYPQDAGSPAQMSAVPTVPGNYLAYYAAVRDAIQGEDANPVPPEQAVQLMALLALGRRSATERRELEVEGLSLRA